MIPLQDGTMIQLDVRNTFLQKYHESSSVIKTPKNIPKN